MYNEERKIRFIEEKTSEASISKSSLSCAFKDSEPFETELGKDVCDFTASEIENMFRTFNSSSIARLNVLKSYYTTYTDWCMGQALVRDFQNHFLEIRANDLERMLNRALMEKRCIGREDVINWCAQLENPLSKVIFLGLFEGLKGELYCELAELKGGDIDFANRTVYVANRGKRIKISKELANYMEDALEEDFYYPMTPSKYDRFALEKSDLVIKNRANTYGSADREKINRARKIHNDVKRCFKYLGIEKWMTANAIYIAGVINFAKTEAEKKGMKPKEYCTSCCSEFKEKYNYNMSAPYAFIKEYSAYFEEK